MPPISAMSCTQTQSQWKTSCLVPLGIARSFFPSCMAEFKIWVLWNYMDEVQHGHCALTISIICLHKLSFLRRRRSSGEVSLGFLAPTPFKCTTGQETFCWRMYSWLTIHKRIQPSGVNFGQLARVSWVFSTYPLVLTYLWWTRVAIHCSWLTRESHSAQGSKVMRKLILRMR